MTHPTDVELEAAVTKQNLFAKELMETDISVFSSAGEIKFDTMLEAMVQLAAYHSDAEKRLAGADALRRMLQIANKQIRGMRVQRERLAQGKTVLHS